LISLLAAVCAALRLSANAADLHSRTAASFAPALLWVHPFFLHHAYAYIPETLSIALTNGTILGTVRYLNTDDRRWAVATGVVLVLAPMTHMWEASILLPVVGLVALQRQWVAATSFTAVGVAAVMFVWWGTNLQLTGPSALFSDSLLGLPLTTVLSTRSSGWHTSVPITPGYL
jgi:hypothetical protein